MSNCTCGLRIVDPVGPPSAKILIVGEYPDGESLNYGMPFGGKRGEVLQGELGRVGIPMQRVRLTYVDRHVPVPNCPGHLTDALREMKGKDGVLLVGAGACERFQLGKVSELVGLTVHSPYFPSDVGFVMVTLNPPSTDFIGEFRLSLEKFAKRLEEIQK